MTTALRTVGRGFQSVGGREVHYRRVGGGPPALFIHSSPANSRFVLPDMLAQADRFTCFAFDTPGFGLSDPLPGETLRVADLADATAEAMSALGLPPAPVFGTHTGAAIALELGYRHPDKVTVLVLDGVPIFTPSEVAALPDDYFSQLAPDPLGGHFSATWTRFRDQYRWFPWCARHPDALNDTDLGSPEAVDDWVQMFFAAAAHYKPAYRAAISYCGGAIKAAAGLRVPAVFTATPADMLHPHLKRLPPLRPDQSVIEIGSAPAGKHRLTRSALESYPAVGEAVVTTSRLQSSPRIRRQFLASDSGALMIRYAGAADAPPLILLHDAPGSGRMLASRISERAEHHLVIAPDIPGSGESEGLPEGAELGDYAETIWRACDMLGLGSARLEGRGFGASLALEMALARPHACRGLAIDGLFLPDRTERAAMQARYAPPITIEADGAHWYRLWLRLRDSLVYWPWYDTRAAAVRRVEADFDAGGLHDWAVEVMKQWRTAHRFPQAVMRHDAAAGLRALPEPPTILSDPLSAFAAAYGDRLADLTVRQGAPA